MKNIVFDVLRKIRLNSVFCMIVSSVFFFSPAVFAIDFGGIISNDSSLQSYGKDELKLDQKNSASLWLRTPFDKTGENYFAGELIYNFEADTQNEEYTNALDFNLLELAFAKKFDSLKCTMNIGRFYFSDFTGNILSQNSDGVKIGLKTNLFELYAYGAYTGLLNSLNTEIITTSPETFVSAAGSRGDAPLVENPSLAYSADKDRIYDFAQKYALSALSFKMPYLFLNQTAGLEFLGAFRLQDESYVRMYATFMMEGPVWKSLYYNVSSTLGFVEYDGEKDISNLSKARLDYFVKNWSFGLNAVYASGKQGNLSAFTGFTKESSTYSLQNLLYSGILKSGVAVSFKPMENMLLSAESDVVFNAAAGEKNDGIEYYGIQYSVGMAYQIKSDFHLGLVGCQFIDKDNSDSVKKTCLGLRAVFAF